jgi:hypothetical protein
MMQNGHVGAMPPSFGGPPVANKMRNGVGNLHQWARLDPSEILVHNIKA